MRKIFLARSKTVKRGLIFFYLQNINPFTSVFSKWPIHLQTMQQFLNFKPFLLVHLDTSSSNYLHCLWKSTAKCTRCTNTHTSWFFFIQALGLWLNSKDKSQTLTAMELFYFQNPPAVNTPPLLPRWKSCFFEYMLKLRDQRWKLFLNSNPNPFWKNIS